MNTRDMESRSDDSICDQELLKLGGGERVANQARANGENKIRQINEAEDLTIGGITWHSSDDDSGPDVGISVFLGNGQRLWMGEITSAFFAESGVDHFDSDGGWFIVWYRPEPILVAKCGDNSDAREFIEMFAAALKFSCAKSREN